MAELEGKYTKDVPIACFGDSIITDEKLKVLKKSWFEHHFVKPLKIKDPSKELLFTNIVQGCNIMVNRAAVSLALPFPNSFKLLPHDHYLLGITAFFGQLGIVNKKLMFYRQHGKNLVGIKNHYCLRKISYLMGKIPTIPLYILKMGRKGNTTFAVHNEIVSTCLEKGLVNPAIKNKAIELEQLRIKTGWSKIFYFLTHYYTGSISSFKCLINYINER